MAKHPSYLRYLFTPPLMGRGVRQRETQKAHSGKASNLIQARVRLAL